MRSCLGRMRGSSDLWRLLADFFRAEDLEVTLQSQQHWLRPERVTFDADIRLLGGN